LPSVFPSPAADGVATSIEEHEEERTEPVENGGAVVPLPFRWRVMQRPRPASWRVPLRIWQGIAAAMLLVILGGSILTAAASAAPGSPLFALRRWEQQLQAQLDTSPAGRVRLHLRFADEALVELETIVAQRQGDDAYLDALTTVRQEDRDATHGLSAVTD